MPEREHPIANASVLLRRTDSSRIRLSLLAAGAVFLLLTACDRPRPAIHLVGDTMGTRYSVKVIGPGAIEPESLQNRIEELLTAINGTMSTYDPNSELSRLNRNSATDWIDVSDQLYTVLEVAMRIGRATGGAFDITIGPLVNLWGFGPEPGARTVPDIAAIESARQRVGIDKLLLRASPTAVRKRRGDVYIDLSAIAKGYAVDQIAAYLDGQGFADYLVEIGGELRASGSNQSGVPWRIGIENPVVEGRVIGQTAPLRDNGMASSGNYRNFFELDGVRYGHTIDPRTGTPTRHRLGAVTVIHPQAMMADAWATALMSLGFDAGLALAREHNLAALFLVAEADKWESTVTPAFGLAIANE